MIRSSLILVFGSYMQDQVYRCAAFPAPGQTVKGQLAVGHGGKGSNQAIAAGRLDAPTLFVGAVGDDAAGREARAFYRAEGIGNRLVVKRGVPTGVAGILVDASGRNEIVIAPGANERLSSRDIPDRVLRSAGIVVTQLEGDPKATLAVLKRARAMKVATLLNPAPLGPDFDLSLLRSVDLLVPNESEFVALAAKIGRTLSEAELTACTPLQLNELCRQFNVPTVVVTLGARGCFASTPDRFELLPACPGVKVVDTTGAGDAFCGGFAAGFVREKGDVFAAARLGNAVGALAVTKPGTAAAMPTASAVAKLLRSRPT